MIDVDYKALEERAAAGEMAGKDVHIELACELFGVSPEEVTPAMRQRAKSLNFLELYSPEPRTLHHDNDSS